LRDELTGERQILRPYGKEGKKHVGKTKDIREAVEAELDFDPLVDSASITVKNLNGEVSQRAAAEQAVAGAAWMANGVVEVDDDLYITG
jgi:osmotically-inducible protein OsmY